MLAQQLDGVSLAKKLEETCSGLAPEFWAISM